MRLLRYDLVTLSVAGSSIFADVLGPRLGLREAEQLQAYVSGAGLEDPRRQRLLRALKEARLPCRVVRHVVRYHVPGAGPG